MDHFWFGDMLNDNITKIKQDINSIKTEDLIGYDAVLFLVCPYTLQELAHINLFTPASLAQKAK